MLIGTGGALLLTTPAAAATGGPIVNARTSRCLDARSTTARLYDCGGQASQTWTVTATGELRLADGSRCVVGSGSAGTAARTATCDGSAAQRFVRGSDGRITATSGLCLDGGAGTNGATVTVQWCTGRTQQRWTVPAADTTPPTAPAQLRVTPSPVTRSP